MASGVMLPAIPPGALGITIDEGRDDDDADVFDVVVVVRDVGEDRRRTTESDGVVDEVDDEDDADGDVDDALIVDDHVDALFVDDC
jgi:hypothetical protein